MVAGIGGIFIYWFVAKKISFKDLCGYAALLLLGVLLFFGLEVYIHSDLLSELFSNQALQTTEVVESNIISKVVTALFAMLSKAFFSGLESYIFLVFVLVLVVGMLSRRDNVSAVYMTIAVFLISYILVSAVRGGSQRFIYMILPVIFLLAGIVISKMDWKQMKGKIVMAVVLLYMLFNAAYSMKQMYVNYGTLDEYIAYGNELKQEMADIGDGRVFTSYDMALTLDGVNKFYMENFSFYAPASEEELMDILDARGVKYIMVDERMRIRMEDGGDEFNIKMAWYNYMRELLGREYSLKKEIYNKFYRQNKGKPAADKRGFRTEIWEKTNLGEK